LFHRLENVLCIIVREARENVVGLRLILFVESFGDAPRILSVCSSCKGEENLEVLYELEELLYVQLTCHIVI